MPFILLIGIFLPRLVSALLYFFTGWFSGVFNTWYWPVLGFIFMPYTMLWYSVIQNWYAGSWDLWHIVVLVIAVVADLSSGAKSSRRS
ncbi:MAG: hypothetical protein AAB365_02245 [Patescibacteria group bacterium]